MAINITLIPVNEADKAFFQQLNILSYKELVEKQFGAWEQKLQAQNFDKKWQEQSFQKAVLDGKAIGGIWVQVFETYHQLREIQLLPEYRNQGIGAQLINTEIERANALGKKLRLRVLLLNPAVQLYERLGFVITGKTDTQYHMEYQG
ncbi:MAG: GNAT family N-acetyltransferase [Pseudomonadota bacterium]